MGRADDERAAFLAATDKDSYLRANSHLPGPRANLELLSVAAEEVDRDWALRGATAPVGDDPTDVFLVSVGVVALGRLMAEGDESGMATLRRRAADGEWRIREAVAIALQRLGDANLPRLAEISTDWVAGNPLEARAAVAAVAEPRLLRDGTLVPVALDVLDAATDLVAGAPAAADPAVRVLRQALGYGWSVVIAADPAVGWRRFERLARSINPDVRWIVAENMKKSRLRRLDLTLPI